MQRCYVINASADWKDALPVTSDVLATVKYLGAFSFQDWGSAYGVEWDSPKKGKNSGIFNQVQYFDCIERRGSFVRTSSGTLEVITEKVGLTFKEAWNLKHISLLVPDAHGNVAVNGPDISLRGCKEIDLSGYAISKLDTANTPWVAQIEKLNLSFNLISTWDQTARQSIVPMKSLNFLNLSGNRFLNIDAVGVEEKEGLKINHLILARCMLRYTPSWTSIVDSFEGLKKLNISSNEFINTDFNSIESMNIESIISLELNENNFTSVKFDSSKWVSLETLDISSCPLNTLHLVSLPKLETLNISETPIASSWKFFGEWLATVDLPQLRTIKLLSNYAIESLDYATNKLRLGESDDLIDYDVLLGLLTTKFPKLTKINGTVYTATQLKEFSLTYENFKARCASVEDVSDSQYITVTIEFEDDNTKPAKKFRIKKGVPWYVIHGHICRLWGLKPGSFILKPEITATNTLS